MPLLASAQAGLGTARQLSGLLERSANVRFGGLGALFPAGCLSAQGTGVGRSVAQVVVMPLEQSSFSLALNGARPVGEREPVCAGGAAGQTAGFSPRRSGSAEFTLKCGNNR